LGESDRHTSTVYASPLANGTKRTPVSRRLRADIANLVTPTPAATSASRFCTLVPRATTRGR
jgi:hypothetical protein